MTNIVHLVVGIVGNASSLFMYGAPIMTFRRVIRKKSTEEFSGFPYAIALLNCLIYTWYGSPLVSNGTDNVLVMTVNGVGGILEFYFVCTFLFYAPTEAKRNMWSLFVALMGVFGIILAVSLFALHDHTHRKLLVGITGMVVTVVMYGSPLTVIKQVIRTKSVEFMPFYLSLFSLLSSCLWMLYFLMDKDLIMAAPNLVGLPLGIGQIVVYIIYHKNKSNRVIQDSILDREMDAVKKNDVETNLQTGSDMDVEKQTPTVTIAITDEGPKTS